MSFLYPFLDASETDPAALLADLASSARAKAADSLRLQLSTLERTGPRIAAAGRAMGERFAAGGQLFAFGNGGSSTDAATLAGLFCRPAWGTAVPAWSLTEDQAVVTALGNDVGFDVIFSRQLIARATPGDVAVALSTSGSSEDLLRGLAEAKRRGLLTIGLAGGDGGRMALSDAVDHCFTVDSPSVHRIQESQAQVGYRLWLAAQETLRETRRTERRRTRERTTPDAPPGGTS